MQYLILVMLLLVGCTAPSGNTFEQLQRTPESWAAVDIDKLNMRVDEAIIADDLWPNSPLMLMLYLFGGDEDAQSVILEETKNRAEGADVATISYIRDGLIDDSVRADWHEVELRLQPDGTWRISKARVAYRCWRGDNTDAFMKNLCP